MPNKAENPDRNTPKHDKEWANERHRKQSGQSPDGQQRAEDTTRRQQGGLTSDESLREEHGRKPGSARDRDYDPDGERPIQNR